MPKGVIKGTSRGVYRAANPQARDTATRIEQYQGKLALLQSCESMSYEWQAANRTYIRDLRRRVAQVRNYILNRSDPLSDSLVQ